MTNLLAEAPAHPFRLAEFAQAGRPRTLTIGLGFIVAYGLLDRLGSLLAPHSPFTPCDMAGGLALALLLRWGLRYAPFALSTISRG